LGNKKTEELNESGGREENDAVPAIAKREKALSEEEKLQVEAWEYRGADGKK
jgi:hypothetical protein